MKKYQVNRAQSSLGEFTLQEINEKLIQGDLKADDLGWTEGMGEWLPLWKIEGVNASSPDPEQAVKIAASDASDAAKNYGKAEAGALKQQFSGGDYMEMNPAVVMILTFCTGGIFGLWYCFKVFRTYTAKAAVRTTDSKGRPLGKARHPMAIIILTYLTGGYYLYWWIYAVMKEISAYTGRSDFSAKTEWCLMMIFPLYAIYTLIFRLPDMIKRTQETAGIPVTTTITNTGQYLNCCMWCGLPFLGMVYQDALNDVWFSSE